MGLRPVSGKSDQAFNGILNRGGRKEGRGQRGCGSGSAELRPGWPQASEPAPAEPADRPQRRPLRNPATRMRLGSRGSKGSAREQSEPQWSWTIPVQPLPLFQLTWRNGERRGDGSRPAGLTLRWLGGPLREAPARTSESKKLRVCASSSSRSIPEASPHVCCTIHPCRSSGNGVLRIF